MSGFTAQQLIDFVYDEADLLDRRQFAQWLDLFDEQGHYWMPLTPGQTDARLQTSLMHEDKLLLGIRIERLSGARTFSEQPATRSHHLLQQPRVIRCDPQGGQYQVRTAFHYVETRIDRQELFAGWATHDLIEVGGALKILLKRVVLVNCDAAFGKISLFM